MQKTLSLGEAWLLETLALYQVPLWCLARDREVIHEWLLRGSHGLTQRELASTLNYLFESRDLEAFYNDEAKEVDLPFIPTLNQVRLAFERTDQKIHCRVSHQGGKRWEHLANPRWDLFYEDSMWDEPTFEIVGASKERISTVLSFADVLWHINIDWNSVNFHRTSPFRPFHWKTLPEGFGTSVKFSHIKFRSGPEITNFIESNREKNSRFQYWMTSICGS